MKKINYKNVSREDIERGIKASFGRAFELTYEELEKKILSGYMYTIDTKGGEPKAGERKVKIHTGQGGVLQYISICKEQRLPAGLCGESIYVYDETIGTQCILDVKITKNG